MKSRDGGLGFQPLEPGIVGAVSGLGRVDASPFRSHRDGFGLGNSPEGDDVEAEEKRVPWKALPARFVRSASLMSTDRSAVDV